MTAIGAKKMGAVKEETPGALKRVFNYVGDVKAELKKVTWTTQDELKVYTKIVVLATFLCGMGTFLADVFIQGVLNGMSMIVRLITG